MQMALGLLKGKHINSDGGKQSRIFVLQNVSLETNGMLEDPRQERKDWHVAYTCIRGN